MRNLTVLRVVSAITIVVLLAHGVRGWVVQLRWVSCIIEVLAAIVVGWLWWTIERTKAPIERSNRAD